MRAYLVINFGKLGKSKIASAPSTLVELFEQLDRKATHQILRPVQAEALVGLDQQCDDRDIILKVSTGSGKTLVGLVYGEMIRRRYPGEPVLYLCPTNQLVEQVLSTAGKIGITAESFKSGQHAHQGFEGKSILVCTYEKLFNARNIFDSRGLIPSGIILDDIHSGVDRIRQKYTVSIPDDAYLQIREIFREICESCDPPVWRDIQNNDPTARFEVPYWLWVPQIPTVEKIIDNFREENEILFSFSNISRYLEQARLCISGVGAELSMAVPATEENMAFHSAKHRLFMSASIKDGAFLIKDLGCGEAALHRIIEPASDRGAGERMILPVSLIDPSLRKSDVGRLCSQLSSLTNVVVLTSSFAQAEVWSEFGAEIKAGSEIDEAVERLTNSSSNNFFVFTQRFDGVDLPDDACRILVVDGIPTGDRICDQIDIERQKNSYGSNMRIVNRLEQALGRSVRSSADYSAVLLVGSDLGSFIGRKDVNELLESHTREQIDLGKALADQVKAVSKKSTDAISEAISALLDRNEEWKEAYRERMSSVVQYKRVSNQLTEAEKVAIAERKAWISSKARNHHASSSILQNAIDSLQLHDSQKADLMQKMASSLSHFEKSKAALVYRAAFNLNSLLPRPPQMPDRKYLKASEQAIAFRDVLQAFINPNAAISRVLEIKAKLAYSGSAELVEQGLQELGDFLGASSSRPEKETGRGPDVLWVFDNSTFCIEAKSEKTSPISKSDAEQLLMSRSWCVETAKLDEESIATIFATNVNKYDRSEDVSFGPLVLNEHLLMKMIDALIGFINGIHFDGPLFMDISKLSSGLQSEGLTSREILAHMRKLGS
ncbi:DEAD/DEAH box helicase [Polynucleobacter sp. es-MAR-4]|uniref:DEAD/DEAH box helicase n=1 Tax=Polynucleobacter sp. es-MAR-4 TaxID=1855655 RepID=UPI001C0AEEBC|nr:DEAD/DEAH box helicase [Polynucleobacter sp. es-MAR-4]MBU3636098.1 DEAD/DEAH box helicase family protein [Polynucleobacter sp. es-MAR-4]